MNIIPAIIPKSFADLEDKVGKIVGVVSLVQVDVCDGKFVPSKSWPFVNNEAGEFEKIVKEEKGLPNWKEIDYETHIMAETPIDEVADWTRAGASKILVHIETGSDTVENVIDEWGRAAEIGLAANLETSISDLAAFFEKVKNIQLMGIQKVGYQGQILDEKIYDRIQELRKLGFKQQISVDGGVNLENAVKLVGAGADKLVVGSAIWESEDPLAILKKFQSL